MVQRLVEVTIDPKRCKQCGICSFICPRQVFTVDPEGNPSVAALDKCIACNLCMFHCPDLAITVGGKNK